MNIFFLSADPGDCARQHCDKHVVKMIVESAQLLSTAHRVLDGSLEDSGTKRYWKHPTESYDELTYKASHVNHPDSIWIRQTGEQYMYLYRLFAALADEYEHRYLKRHQTFENLYKFLNVPPRAIWNAKGWSDPPQCMPDVCKDETTIQGYRNYYIDRKIDFIRYTNRRAPDWIRDHLETYHKNTNIAYERTKSGRV